MQLNDKDGQELIVLARESIHSYFSKKDLLITDEIKKKYSEKQGVFVTLNLDGNLRGCIGFPEPVYQLYKAVSEAAMSAAFNDPRFNALTKEEFDRIKIELSVLTVPEMIKSNPSPLEYLDKIKIGEDGLIIKSEHGSGLLLPQVFPEYNCDSNKALEMTCEKAGLDKDAWKNLNNKIFKFQAHIFKE